MGTATLVKDLQGWAGDASVYCVDPPMKRTYYDPDNDADITKDVSFIIISAAVVSIGCSPREETYIFPCDSEGKPLDMLEMPGSQLGVYSHEVVLEDLGYSIVKGANV